MVSLTDRERHVLELREEGLTLAAIGERLGITRERVRQLELSAKRKTLPYTELPICPVCNNLRPRIRHSHLCKCAECGKEFIYATRA